MLKSVTASQSVDEVHVQQLRLVNAKPAQCLISVQSRAYVDHTNLAQRIRVVLMDATLSGPAAE